MNPPTADHGYGRPSGRPRVSAPATYRSGTPRNQHPRPSGRPRVSAPATYRSGTPRNQHPAVTRWHAHLHGLATSIRETFGLKQSLLSTYDNELSKIGLGKGSCCECG
jgi:hypothetical protein